MTSDELLQSIRALRTSFKVLNRTSDELLIAVDLLTFQGATTSAVLRFVGVRRPWASEWDTSTNQWTEVPELSQPVRGNIVEAFVKRVGAGGLTFSFSDMGEPLVRWGFLAKEMTILSPDAVP